MKKLQIGIILILYEGKGRRVYTSSEIAEMIINEIYPQLYFSLPRLQARPSPTKINERCFSILLLLEKASKEEKTLAIGGIAKICRLSPSDTTRKIKDLEKKGFGRKSISNSDDRTLAYLKNLVIKQKVLLQ